MPAPDVVVVGAGFAGLSAAVDLAGRGARVLVLEARPGLGGRAAAFTDPETGEVVDNGQHALFGCYHETFRFLRTIGTGSPRAARRPARDRGHRSKRPALTPAIDAPAAAFAPGRRPAALDGALLARSRRCPRDWTSALARGAAAPPGSANRPSAATRDGRRVAAPAPADERGSASCSGNRWR